MLKTRMIHALALALLSLSVANAQYAGSASGSSTAAAEINGKINHQEAASGSACMALNGTLGKDRCTDTSTGDVYDVITTGTPATWRRASVGSINSQTSTYTAVSADANKLIKMNGSSLTLNLPASPPFAAWKVWVQNLAASDLTVSRNSLTINGGTSNITLKQYGFIEVWTDGTNYLSSVPLIAGSNITLTPGPSGLTIAAAGGSGTGCIPAGSSGQLLTDSGAGGCNSVTALPTASEPAHTGDVTNSAGSLALTIANLAVTTAKIADNAVTSAKMAAANTRRTICIPFGAKNASSALADTDLADSDLYFVPAAATLVEITVRGDAGTPNVILGRDRAGSVVNLTSSALATAASGALACSNAGGTTGLDGATTCGATLQNTSLSAGDWIKPVSGTAGGTAKQMSACLTMTVN